MVWRFAATAKHNTPTDFITANLANRVLNFRLDRIFHEFDAGFAVDHFFVQVDAKTDEAVQRIMIAQVATLLDQQRAGLDADVNVLDGSHLPQSVDS